MEGIKGQGKPEAWLTTPARSTRSTQAERSPGNFGIRNSLPWCVGTRIPLIGERPPASAGGLSLCPGGAVLILMEDCGFLPTVDDWMRHLDAEPWMVNAARKLSRELVDA